MLHRPGIIKARAGVAGRYMWDLLDERGRPDREATRRAGGGRWRKNLITDLGLKDLFTESPSGRFWYSDSGVPVFRSSRRYLVLGDGSTAPTAADTALESFVGATESNGGVGMDFGYAEDGVDVLFTATQTRVYTAGANVTVREWGYSLSNNGSNVDIRELFRDEAGAPVSVSLLTGRKLRHAHTLEVRVPKSQAVAFDVEEFDVGGGSLGTTGYTGTLTFHANDAGFQTNAADVLMFQNRYQEELKLWYWASRPTAPAWNADVPSGGQSAGDASFGAAQGGPTRALLWGANETEANDAAGVQAIAIQPGSGKGGWLLVLDDPQAIVKDNLKTLLLSLELTFSRS